MKSSVVQSGVGLIGLLMLLGMAPTANAVCDVDAINRIVSRSLPRLVFEKVRAAPIPGLCEALIDTEVFYVSETGKYLLVGNLIAISSGSNLTAQRRAAIVKTIMDDLDEKQMIHIGPAKAKRTITVFTDVDCPYCARLHEEVPQLTKKGVKVRYLLYPRNGIHTSTYKKSVSVWCAKDRIKAIGIAKAGGELKEMTCTNPVADHYQLGQRLGITGTPTLILEDGTRIGGYVPAPRLLTMLGLSGKIIKP
ncbi:MAG: DsbC family protein [Acidiferrobacterales bacterium]